MPTKCPEKRKFQALVYRAALRNEPERYKKYLANKLASWHRRKEEGRLRPRNGKTDPIMNAFYHLREDARREAKERGLSNVAMYKKWKCVLPRDKIYEVTPGVGGALPHRLLMDHRDDFKRGYGGRVVRKSRAAKGERE